MEKNTTVKSKIDSILIDTKNNPKENQTQQTIKNQDPPPTKKPSTQSKIKKILTDHFIALLLLCIGLLYLTHPTLENIKISFTYILIGTFLMFLMNNRLETTHNLQQNNAAPSPQNKIRTKKNLMKEHIQLLPQKIRSLPLSTRISIVLILWTLLLFALISDIELYFILVFIGILVTRELTDNHTSNTYKKRLDAYLVIFLITYIALLSQKIIDIVTP